MDSVWFEIYLVGCLLAVPMMLLNTVIIWFLNWLTKTNILIRNLKKLAPPDETSLSIKTLKIVGIYVFETALSWVSVAAGLFQLARVLLSTVREALTSIPEAIRTLRFPLRNNPELSRESVWAHAFGLRVLAGDPPGSASEILSSLAEIGEHHRTFDGSLALRQLKALHVVEPEMITEALASLGPSQDSWRAT